jgi:hypothetical protein
MGKRNGEIAMEKIGKRGGWGKRMEMQNGRILFILYYMCEIVMKGI